MRYIFIFMVFVLTGCATCKYSTKDTSPIPPEIKTFRVTYFENRASYVNSQLAPQLTEKLKQKIISQTRLRQVNNDDAHYDISGTVTEYFVSTSGIAGQNATTNRLNVGFHLIFKNKLDQKKDFETDLTRNYDFNAQLSLTQAEGRLLDELIKNMVDEIFNKIFSNW